MGQTTNKQTIKNHYSLIGQLNIDFYRKLIAIQTFSGVMATEFDFNKIKNNIFKYILTALLQWHLALPWTICQMIRRNGDHKATKLFIGLRHPFIARIQVINVHDSLIVYTHTLSSSLSLWNIFELIQLRHERSSRTSAPYHE